MAPYRIPQLPRETAPGFPQPEENRHRPAPAFAESLRHVPGEGAQLHRFARAGRPGQCETAVGQESKSSGGGGVALIGDARTRFVGDDVPDPEARDEGGLCVGRVNTVGPTTADPRRRGDVRTGDRRQIPSHLRLAQQAVDASVEPQLNLAAVPIE